MIWVDYLAIAVGVALGLLVAWSIRENDRLKIRRLEEELAFYADTVEDLGKALREAYAFLHVAGEWDEFSSTGFTIDPPPPTAIADGERRAIRAARAIARDRGTPPRDGFGRELGDVFGNTPLGHTRLGIDPPSRRRSR